MKRQITKYFVIGILTLLYSCSPMTKESYLNDYKEFINEVGNKHSTYTEEDWKSADDKFQKFSKEWHTKFKDEIVWKEQITLAKYEVKYNFYKYKEDANKVINNVFNSYDGLEKTVKYYAENDMEKDLEFLIKQANEIGGEASKMLEEILNDIDIKLKTSNE